MEETVRVHLTINGHPREGQCGFCTPAVLCRCTGYQGIVAAVAAAGRVLDPPR